jgi:predicted ATPase/DNA-binding CsgD family transcriptional regulator
LIKHGGRLPAETSGFFGRSQEAAVIKGALASSRLVTLTGPGGVGKTRLAVKVAGELTREFPDGVCLADLSAARDAAGAARAVASALGLQDGQQGKQRQRDQDLPPPDWLASQLRGRHLLLILDTCEHAIDASVTLANAILRGGGPALMVTSRQPLDLPGEVVLRIPPLAVGADGGDAVSLFADRAAAAVPGFEATADTLPRLVRLCRLLDGIPLQIEFAALRLRAVGLDELLTRLPGHLRLLGCGRHRPAADRHQSLLANISWSYDLCSEPERLLWARLSVFADSFDLAAAEQVCSGGELGADEILDTLVGLVEKSVVLRVDDADGAARYRLPGIVREHGAAHADGTDTWAARYRAYYSGYSGVARAMPGNQAGQQPGAGGVDQAAEAPQFPAHALPGSGLSGPPPDLSAIQDSGRHADPHATEGGRWELLTAREREVAGLVAGGLTNKDIASRLVVSKRTVDAHVAHILSKLGLSSRLQVAARASPEHDRERRERRER